MRRQQPEHAMDCSLTAASSRESASDGLGSEGDTRIPETPKGMIQPSGVSQGVLSMPRLELPLSCSARASPALKVIPPATSQHSVLLGVDAQAREVAHDRESDGSVDATSDSECPSGCASDAAASGASGVEAVLQRLQHGQARLAEVQGDLQEMQIRVLTYVEDKLQEHRAALRRELTEEVVKQVTTALGSRCDDLNMSLLEHDASGTERNSASALSRCASSSRAPMEPMQSRALEKRAAEQESVAADRARKIDGIRADLASHAKRFAAMEEGLRSSIGSSVEELRRFQDTVSALIATGESEVGGQLMRKAPTHVPLPTVASISTPVQFRNEGFARPRSEPTGVQTEALLTSRVPSVPRGRSECCTGADGEFGSQPLSSRFPRSSVHPLVSPTSTTRSQIVGPDPPSPQITVQHRPVLERLPCEQATSGTLLAQRFCPFSPPNRAQDANAQERSSSVPLSPTRQPLRGEPKSFVSSLHHCEDGSRSAKCPSKAKACQVRSSQTNMHEWVWEEGAQPPPQEVGSGCVMRTPSLTRQEPSTDVANWMLRQVQVVPPSRYQR